MTRAIYILALCNNKDYSYSHWAVNLALSVKFYSPGMRVILLHDGKYNLREEEKNLFEFIQVDESDYTDNGAFQPGKCKLHISKYFVTDESILIDADSIVIKDLNELFDLCSGNDIAMDVVWSGDQNSTNWGCHWMGFQDLKTNYELPNEYKIFEVNSSFIYSKRTEKAIQFWEQAIKNYLPNYIGLWGKAFPDELAFNVATAQVGIDPRIEKGVISVDSKINKSPKGIGELANNHFILTFWGNRRHEYTQHYTNYDLLAREVNRKLLGRQNPYKHHILMDKKYAKVNRSPIVKAPIIKTQKIADTGIAGKPKLTIIGRDNGVGLTKDKNILTSILTDYDLTFKDDKKASRSPQKDDICIFTEIVDPRFYGKYNILIPNQEWFFDRWIKELKNFQAIWVKTKLAYNIFSTLHHNVKYIGFTSVDMFKEVDKVKECFHTKGKSSDKGTEFLTEWSGILPLNIISDQHKFKNANHINHRLPDDKFMDLANKCLIHLCPSTMEGFGHYINEAKSMCNVVITTDSEPMNEIITDKRFLAKVVNATTKSGSLGTYTRTNISEIEKVLNDIKDLDLLEIGKQNRIEFLKQDADFKERLKYELSKI